jgi:hypothetical protein
MVLERPFVLLFDRQNVRFWKRTEICQRRMNMQSLVREGHRAYRVVSHVPFYGSQAALGGDVVSRVAGTQGTMRLVRQALARLRRVGAVALGCEGLGLLRWRGWSRHRALGPGEVHEDDEPEEGAEDALREHRR